VIPPDISSEEIPKNRVRQLAALSGLIGPLVFAGMTSGLTVAQYDFMRSLGWHPIRRPDLDWPSGLSLGPLGSLQIANFIVSGVLLVVAGELHRGVSDGRGSKTGPTLLAVSGASMMLLAFETQPTLGGEGWTWHGWIHDAAFVLLAVSLVAALVALWRRMERDPRWRAPGQYTLATAALAALVLALPVMRFYLFLAVTLVWIEVMAIRPWRVGAV
jgi:hypothetical protein